jgi:hypothetical protein
LRNPVPELLYSSTETCKYVGVNTPIAGCPAGCHIIAIFMRPITVAGNHDTLARLSILLMLLMSKAAPSQ